MLRNYKLTVVYLLLVIALIASFVVHNTETNASGAGLSVGARWGETISVFSDARGNPWINLTDGKRLEYDVVGQAKNSFNLEDESFDSISGATADFDSDGMQDLVIGHKIGSEGYFSIIRGNVDSVFPNTPEARERLAKGVFTSAPFIGPARVIKLDGLVPDYFAAGDFDADGNFDLAVAERGQNSIAFYLGNGKGGFAQTRSIELGGEITAFLSQDFNRNDGTDDLIVGIRTKRGSQLLVFESPYGVLKSEPEVFDLSGEITSLAIGSIEGDARYDLAIAAGNELVILRGRDRRLIFDPSGASAEPVELSSRQFDFHVEAVTVGEFIKGSNYTSEIALLSDDGRVHLFEKEESNSFGSSHIVDLGAGSVAENPTSERKTIMLAARVSARPVDTLIVGYKTQVHLLTSDFISPRNDSEPADFTSQEFGLQASLDAMQDLNAILPMRLNVDALSDLVVLEDGSATPAIVQTAPMATYVVNSPLIEPDANPGDGLCLTFNGGCTLRAAIEEANNQPGSHTINFDVDVEGVPTTGGPGVGIFSPLVIDGTTQEGGLFQISGNAGAPANLFTGSQTDNCVFRGLVMNDQGPNYYLNPQGRNNIVEGNRIGTNPAGTAVVSSTNNTGGVAIGGGNLVGGTAVAARNIISTGSNGGEGVGVAGLPDGLPDRVIGNYIGTDITGNIALGNFGSGVRVQGPNLRVGGTEPGSRNVISATSGDQFFGADGIKASDGDGSGEGRLIQGNYIGTNAAGTAALGNQRHGIIGQTGAPIDTVGGTNPAARNVISGNGMDGIEIFTTGVSSLNPMIIGNYVGTNAAGSSAIQNGEFGIFFGGSIRTLVGANVVSGNLAGGIRFCCNQSSGNDVITLNLIGTDAANKNVIGNGGIGLSISSDLGGATQDATITFNTIAGNGSHGILVSNGSNLIIRENYVGASPKNNENFGNEGDGVRLENAPMNNDVSFNRIISNGGKGINLASTSQFDINNVFSYNEISDNAGLGIDLGGDGVTENDHCDIDTGTNALQNFPVISTATRIGNNIRMVGSFNSVPNADYNLSFYANQAADPTGYGEGHIWLGDFSLNVPSSCQASFTLMVPYNLQSGRCVTATAIDDDGNTSEFSNCIRIRNTPNSFDGDGLTDVAIYRPSVGQWWFLRSSDGSVFAAEFGTSTDRITPGDWTGDGVADMAFWRPSTGEWFVVRSEDFSFFAFPFGSSGDIPTPADYDGDGIFDPAVFRQSAGIWFVLRSSDGNVEITQFGSSGDKPVVADYDGDGRDDIAIFRPGPGEWWYRRSLDNTVTALQFGLSTDLPVQGDYTGDGKADIALWRPSIGFWYVLRSEDNSYFGFPWGSNGDIPAPADYDGDGKFDPAVFRPPTATWFIYQTTAGTSIFNFGATGDKPVPSAYIPMP